MMPSLALRIEHAFKPGLDASAPGAVAEILTRPCFAELKRTALEKPVARTSRHVKTSAQAIESYLRDPKSSGIAMDSGRQGELVASATIDSGWQEHDDPVAKVTFPAPLVSHLVVPQAPAMTQARLDAFCDLATVLRAVAGCVSVEPYFGVAHSLSVGGFPPTLEQLRTQPGMSLRRYRERRAYTRCFNHFLDRLIPGPEWGLYLGRKHLDAVSADALAASGVFHAVRRLGPDLVFVQLTPDPADALQPDHDDMLDQARAVLAPILMDISDIEGPPGYP